MAKTRSEIAAAIILFAHGLLVFVPAMYFSGALFFKCVPYVYYGMDRAWSESITAEPLGKAWIRFSTGEITSYGATDALSLATILLLILPFLALAATLFHPVFQVTQLCLAKVAPGIAKELDVRARPNVQQNARERVIHADEPARRKRVLTLKPKAIEAAALIVWLILWVAIFVVTLARTTDINFGTIVVGLVLAGFRSLVAFFVGVYAPVRIMYTLVSRARRSKPEARVEIAAILVMWFVASCYFCFSVVPRLREGERPRDVETRKSHSRTFSEVPGSPEHHSESQGR